MYEQAMYAREGAIVHPDVAFVVGVILGMVLCLVIDLYFAAKKNEQAQDSRPAGSNRIR